MTVDIIIIILQWWNYQIKVKGNQPRGKLSRLNIKLTEKSNNIKRSFVNRCVNWDLKTLNQKVINNLFRKWQD